MSDVTKLTYDEGMAEILAIAKALALDPLSREARDSLVSRLNKVYRDLKHLG